MHCMRTVWVYFIYEFSFAYIEAKVRFLVFDYVCA